MDESELTERERIDDCVAKVLDGDRDAFRAIVDQFLNRVRALVVGRSLPGVDVDDVVQRSFVEAYKNLADYQAGTNFQAWLLTIARYQLMAETTRLRRRSDYHAKYVPEAIARQNLALLDDPDAEDERLQYLIECLSELPEAARDVIRRRYHGEESSDAIASALDRSAGAVRKQLCLLRKQLHTCVSHKLSAEVGS